DRTTRRAGSNALIWYSIGVTRPRLRIPRRYRAPTPTGPSSIRSEVATPGSQRLALAKSATKANAASSGRAVSIVSCKRGIVGVLLGPGLGPFDGHSQVALIRITRRRVAMDMD